MIENDVKRVLEEMKEDPQIVDNMMFRYSWHDALLKSLKLPYLLLLEKAITRETYENPNFTDGERQERDRLVKGLSAAMKTINVYQIQIVIDEEPERAIENPFMSELKKQVDEILESVEGPGLRDRIFALNGGLYLLARCGDESAFLQLAEVDPLFWINWFFHQSLFAWKKEVYQEENKRAQATLRSLARILQKPAGPATKPKQFERGLFAKVKFQHYKEIHPSWLNSRIYRQIVKDWKDTYGETVTPEAIRKRIERYDQQEPLLSPRWPFEYLEEKYREKM